MLTFRNNDYPYESKKFATKVWQALTERHTYISLYIYIYSSIKAVKAVSAPFDLCWRAAEYICVCACIDVYVYIIFIYIGMCVCVCVVETSAAQTFVICVRPHTRTYVYLIYIMRFFYFFWKKCVSYTHLCIYKHIKCANTFYIISFIHTYVCLCVSVHLQLCGFM